MTRLILLLLALPVSANALTIEAREMVTTTPVHGSWRYDSGWRDSSNPQRPAQAIEVILTDLTGRCPSIKLYVFFTARSKSDSERFVYDFAVLDVQFRGQIQVRDSVQAPPVSLNHWHYSDASSDTRLLFPGKAEGWLVIGSNESEILVTAASSPSLLDIAKSEGALPQLLGTAEHRDRIELFRKVQARATESVPNRQLSAFPSPVLAGTALQPTTAPSTPRPGSQLVRLTVPVQVEVHFGKVTLPRGTILEVVSRSENNITAIYLNQTVIVPLASTDLK